jgi:hypothetical protein
MARDDLESQNPSGASRRREWDSGYPESLRFSRAREYHLYTPEGARYLDCVLGGGSAPLGHNPGGLTQAVKNRLTSGPMVPAPGKEEGKLRQAARRLFPAVRWVVPVYIDDLPDPFLERTSLWRPFEGELPKARLAAGRGAQGKAPPPPESRPQPPGERFLLVPGFPLEPRLLLYCGTGHEASWEVVEGPWARGADDPARQAQSRAAEDAAEDAARAAAAPGPNPAGVESAGLAEAAAAAAKAAAEEARGSESELSGEGKEVGGGEPPAGGFYPVARQVSPVLLAGATKAVNLVASAYEGESLPRKLTTREEEGWRKPLSTGKLWERDGIYYRYIGPPELYEKVRTRLQECGILISRHPRQRMVLPRIITPHERSLWDGVTTTL